jgi:hypothetical protein
MLWHQESCIETTLEGLDFSILYEDRRKCSQKGEVWFGNMKVRRSERESVCKSVRVACTKREGEREYNTDRR